MSFGAVGTGVRQTKMIGYETQAKQVSELLGAARAGGPVLGLVTGESGAGRTTFLGAVAELAGTGFLVVSARGHPSGRHQWFGVAARILATVLERQDDVTLAAGRPVEQRLLCGGFAEPPQDIDETTVLHSLRAFYRELTAQRRLLITVDDVDWVDHPSQRWLADAGTCGGGRVAVVLAGAERPLPIGGQLVPEVAAAVRIDLDGLDAAAVRRFAEQQCGVVLDGVRAAAVREATGGVPFLVRELLLNPSGDTGWTVEVIRAAAPKAVADELGHRLTTADPVLLDVARAVTILADHATVLAVARMLTLDVPAVLSAVDVLADAGVLRNGQPLTFAHPVVRNAVREHLPLGSKVFGHTAAAILLHDDDFEPEDIATHLVAAGPVDLDWAADMLRAAARQALSRGARDAAVRYLRHALREQLPAHLRPVVLRELGEAELPIAPGNALRHLGGARRDAEDPRVRGEVALLMADALAALGRDVVAVDLLAGAVRELAGRDEECERRLRLALADLTLRTEAIEPPSPDRLGEDEPAWTALRALHCAHVGEDRDRAMRLALEVVHTTEKNQQLSAGYWYALVALLHADELDTVEACAALGQAAAANACSPRHVAAALRCRGAVLAKRGHLVRATELLGQSVDLLRGTGMEACFANRIGVARLVDVLVRRGRPDEAREVLRTADVDGPRADRATGHLLHARGSLRYSSGDLAGGLDDLLEAGRLLRAVSVHNPAVVGWRPAVVRALLARAEPRRAGELACEHLDAARRWGTAREVGAALHTAALCGDERIALLRRAVAALERTDAPVELADALADLGVAWYRAGDAVEAHSCLTRAAELAQQCDAVPLRRRALAALAEAPGPCAAAASPLTKREAMVVALARRGWTNREISQKLHISQRTAELHLSSAYRKFGISGRRELAEMTWIKPGQQDE